MTIPTLERGKMLVIYTDGDERIIPMERDSLGQIESVIGAAKGLDFVAIGRANGTDLVMAVDDDGWNYEVVKHSETHLEHRIMTPKRPINQKATTLYHAICKPGTTHQIAGDVCICHDGDFGA
jgi:hypothetical protein